MTACICRPRDPEGWYREDCPTHGRGAKESRADERKAFWWRISGATVEAGEAVEL